MNRDDIIRMAQEAGMHFQDGVADPWTATQEELECFAELVAAEVVKECVDWINENVGLIDEAARVDLLKHFKVNSAHRTERKEMNNG